MNLSRLQATLREATSRAAVFSDVTHWLPVLDFTRLTANDNAESMQQWASKAHTPWGKPAALCVQAEWLELLKDQHLTLATVANFPTGNADLETVIQQIQKACLADEIDIVFPYADFMKGHGRACFEFIKQCREATSGKILKIILETGAYFDAALLKDVAELVLEVDVDFLKTSTGTLSSSFLDFDEACAILLEAIQQRPGKKVGFKASGGIAKPLQAGKILALTELYGGTEALIPERVRIGSSKLLEHPPESPVLKLS